MKIHIATWGGQFEVATSIEVATWVSLESVATWNFEVATRLEVLGGSKGGCDMEKWRRDVAEMGLG